jgi:hypothetical protein
MLKGTVIFDCAALHGSARIQPCRPCRPDRSIRGQARGGPRKCRNLGPAEAVRVMETATRKPDSEDEPDPRKADLNIAGDGGKQRGSALEAGRMLRSGCGPVTGPRPAERAN